MNLTNMLLATTPDELLLSRKHCHAKNVSSIVIRKNPDGSLVRMFLAWPAHRLWTNIPGMRWEVGVHDHTYDLTLYHLGGVVRNHLYQKTAPHRSTLKVMEYQFTSAFNPGGGRMKPVGVCGVVNIGTNNLAQHGPHWMSRDCFHTISVDQYSIAAWAVKEGPRYMDKPTTTMFSNSGATYFDCDNPFAGLYEPFAHPDDVLEHVEEFSRLTTTEQRP